MGRSRLYDLRSGWLRDRAGFEPGASGGDRRGAWPPEVVETLRSLVRAAEDVNFALLADEIGRRHGFVRSRASVAAYVRTHLTGEGPAPGPRGPRPRRRWQCARTGELWQHDSSPHAWWAADRLPVLLLSLDDHSRRILGGRFVPSETTWEHFRHFRAVIARHGLPQCVYTDGLSLFGHHGTADGQDPLSQFQRVFLGLGCAHRVAPSPQAKGKIERRFGFLQNRLVALLAAEGIVSFGPANDLLAAQIDWHNASHTCRTTGLTPDQAWEKAGEEGRSCLRPAPPDAILDLHLSLRLIRRVDSDHTVAFLGKSWPIARTVRRNVTILHHPDLQFWVVDEPPAPEASSWPTILAHYRL